MKSQSHYSYYLLKERYLSRGKSFGIYEWHEDEKWVENHTRSRFLTDCMMDYAGCSPSDYDMLSEEEAKEFIEKFNRQ